MNVLADEVVENCFSTKCGDSFHRSTFYMFHKKKPPAYWTRVILVELAQVILAVIAVSSVPTSYNQEGEGEGRQGQNFQKSAVAKTVVAAALNMISWPWFFSSMIIAPPAGVSRFSFFIVNTEIAASMFAADASYDIMQGGWQAGAPTSGLAIFNSWLAVLSICFGIFYAWFPQFKTLVADRSCRQCIHKPEFWVSGLVKAFVVCWVIMAAQFTGRYSGGKNTSVSGVCSQAQCSSTAGNCDGAAGFDGIFKNGQTRDSNYRFKNKFRQRCEKDAQDTQQNCGFLWGADSKDANGLKLKYKFIFAVHGLTDDTYAEVAPPRKVYNDDVNDDYDDWSVDTDTRMAGEYCTGTCWWGFENQADCVAFYRKSYNSPNSQLFTGFTFIFGYAVLGIACVVLFLTSSRGWFDVVAAAKNDTGEAGATHETETPALVQENPEPRPAELPVHCGVACDRSGMKPIVGARYSVQGANYDLCEAEFAKLPEVERRLYVKIACPGALKEPQTQTLESDLELGNIQGTTI